MGIPFCNTACAVHCHFCDKAYSNVDELYRSKSVLFACSGGPFQPDVAALLHAYARGQVQAVVAYCTSLPLIPYGAHMTLK